MINFFHRQIPNPILFSFGPINIYWYGFCIIIGIILAMLVILKLSKYYKINQEVIFDLIFYLMLAGIIGARIYDVLLEFSYYAEHPINIFKFLEDYRIGGFSNALSSGNGEMGKLF